MSRIDKLFMSFSVLALLVLASFIVAQCSRSAECEKKGGVLVQGGFNSTCVKLEKVE